MIRVLNFCPKVRGPKAPILMAATPRKSANGPDTAPVLCGVDRLHSVESSRGPDATKIWIDDSSASINTWSGHALPPAQLLSSFLRAAGDSRTLNFARYREWKGDRSRIEIRRSPDGAPHGS